MDTDKLQNNTKVKKKQNRKFIHKNYLVTEEELKNAQWRMEIWQKQQGGNMTFEGEGQLKEENKSGDVEKNQGCPLSTKKI